MYVDDMTRLRHMLDAAKEAIAFASGRSGHDLRRNRMLALALVKDIEIIGEAANHISPAYRNEHPQIAWQQIIGMRNRLIHGYSVIDVNVVWVTVSSDLPPLIAELEKLILPAS